MWYEDMKNKSSSIKSKAVKFNRLHKIKPTSEKSWIVEHIPNYNKTDHTVFKNGDKFTCDCQWFTHRGKICSHIAGVLLFIENHQEPKRFYKPRVTFEQEVELF